MSQLWCFRITGELFALTKEMEHVHQRLKSQEVTWAPNMAIYFTYILHFWPDTAVVFGHGKNSKISEYPNVPLMTNGILLRSLQQSNKYSR